MNVSVAIACLNEGPDLEATIALLAAGKTVPSEVVVFDDGSLVPVAPRLSHWFPWVKVLRSEVRTGSGPAKHAAASVCTGDAVVVMDAHMRPPWDWLDYMVEESALHPSAILCARSTGFESWTGFDGQGADLTMGDAGFWDPKWAAPSTARGGRAVPCVYGGLYFIPRTILEAVGGYAPCYTGWGCEEEYLSLRAWITGHKCMLVPRVVVPHQYTRSIDRRDASGGSEVRWEIHHNRHVAAVVCFGEQVYSQKYARRIPLPGPCASALMKNETKIKAAMDHIALNRTVQDEELAALCGVVHPSE
jgi:GT2 family glycosyltransferase